MRRFSSSISARRMPSNQELHERIFAAEARLECRHIGRLLGGAPQSGHAGDELCRLLVSGIAAGVGEPVDALGVDLERLARCVASLAWARVSLHPSHTSCLRAIAHAPSNIFACTMMRMRNSAVSSHALRSLSLACVISTT